MVFGDQKDEEPIGDLFEASRAQFRVSLLVSIRSWGNGCAELGTCTCLTQIRCFLWSLIVFRWTILYVIRFERKKLFRLHEIGLWSINFFWVNDGKMDSSLSVFRLFVKPSGHFENLQLLSGHLHSGGKHSLSNLNLSVLILENLGSPDSINLLVWRIRGIQSNLACVEI